jgi:hypothetical protein
LFNRSIRNRRENKRGGNINTEKLIGLPDWVKKKYEDDYLSAQERKKEEIEDLRKWANSKTYIEIENEKLKRSNNESK